MPVPNLAPRNDDRGDSAAVPAKPRAGWLRRLYLTLRTEHTSPGKLALGVATGIAVGFSPFWGVHLLLAVAAATLFRLNRVLVYAAANVVNPLTFAPVALLEIQVGHRLRTGSWMRLTLEELRGTGVTGFVSDFLVGGLVVAVAAGAVAWVVTYPAVRLGRLPEPWVALADRIALRYLDASIRDAEGARLAILRDPIYPFLLEESPYVEARRILDLGCGRAVLGALEAERGLGDRAYVGVDDSERYVRVARLVLGDPGITLHRADLRDFDPPSAEVVLVLDVLRFLPVAAQDALLRRLGKSLPPGARLYVREVDRAARGLRFLLAATADTLGRLLPGRARHGLHYRRAGDLRNALAAAGFEVRDRSTLRAGAPARVLFEAVRRPAAAPPPA